MIAVSLELKIPKATDYICYGALPAQHQSPALKLSYEIHHLVCMRACGLPISAHVLIFSLNMQRTDICTGYWSSSLRKCSKASSWEQTTHTSCLLPASLLAGRLPMPRSEPSIIPLEHSLAIRKLVFCHVLDVSVCSTSSPETMYCGTGPLQRGLICPSECSCPVFLIAIKSPEGRPTEISCFDI